MTGDPHPALVIDDTGTGGRPILVLHGGGGPDTVKPIIGHLVAGGYRVLTPTHPGWNGAPRAEWLRTAGDYAQAYLDHLTALGLSDVVVVGSSLGGWITAEMAARDTAGVMGGAVILDGAGIFVADQPITDFFSLTPREVAEHSWHDPDRFFVDPSTFAPERVAMQRSNMQTMGAVFTGMNDPELRDRLSTVTIPVLVIWGDSDQIFTPGYGRAYAESFAFGRFELVAGAGHLPHLEQPAATLGLIVGFLKGLDH